MNIIAHFFLQPEGTARFAPFEKNQSKEVVDMVLTIIFQVMFMIAFVLTLPNKANLNRISLHYLFPLLRLCGLSAELLLLQVECAVGEVARRNVCEKGY